MTHSIVEPARYTHHLSDWLTTFGDLPREEGDAMGEGGSRGRGELAELEQQLKVLAGRSGTSKDVIESRRLLFKRVLGYMTQGVDMSPLFPTMVQNSATNDIVTKKMLYHFFSHYAHTKQEIALLTVNTLVKDCGDDDPTIRALALRNLTDLRVPSLVEYLVRCQATDDSVFLKSLLRLACLAPTPAAPEDPLHAGSPSVLDVLFRFSSAAPALLRPRCPHPARSSRPSPCGFSADGRRQGWPVGQAPLPAQDCRDWRSQDH